MRGVTSGDTAGNDSAAAGSAGWTVAQAGRAAGLTRKAIRVYEARGLVGPVWRTPNGYRRFHGQDIERLRFIRRARALGMGLDDIADILTEHDAGRSPCASVRTQLEARIGEIDQAVSELLALRAGLLAAAGRCVAESPADDVICPIIHGRSGAVDQPGR